MINLDIAASVYFALTAIALMISKGRTSKLYSECPYRMRNDILYILYTLFTDTMIAINIVFAICVLT